MVKLFENIFKKQQSSDDEDQTVPLLREVDSKNEKSNVYKPLQMVVGTGQSVGRQRDHNEDALFSFNSMLLEAESEYPFGIFIIADGMGGHQHGEVASGATVRVMADYLLQNIYIPLLSLEEEKPKLDIQKILEEGVNKVQDIVINKVPGGGTTLTVAVVNDEKVTIAHVGDSRAYFLFSDGRYEVVTHDHSLVQRLVDLGQITEEEAKVHPQRNVLYRAIGQNEPFQPDINFYPLPQPGYILICSDGLWGQVPGDKISKIVLSEPNLSQACVRLIEAANSAGGPDNISVVIVKILE